jgi:hypothetical protein
MPMLDQLDLCVTNSANALRCGAGASKLGSHSTSANAQRRIQLTVHFLFHIVRCHSCSGRNQLTSVGELRGCPNLRNINLFSNQLTGTVPQFSALTNKLQSVEDTSRHPERPERTAHCSLILRVFSILTFILSLLLCCCCVAAEA